MLVLHPKKEKEVVVMNQQTAGLYHGEKVEQYYEVVKGGSSEETGGIDEKIFQHLLGELPISLHGKRALDLGCGDGRWSKVLHERGADVIAVDKSPEMLARVSQRKKGHELERLTLLQADMQELPLPDTSIHLALASFCLMYFSNLEPIIGEIARVLVPGGSLFIATNLVEIHPPALVHQLEGKVVPIEACLNDKTILLDNVVQPLSRYLDAFRVAALSVRSYLQFEPEGFFFRCSLNFNPVYFCFFHFSNPTLLD